MVTIEYHNILEEIHISKKLKNEYGITQHRIILKIGNWSKEYLVKMDDELAENKIGIPVDITKTFTIPNEVPFELVLTGRTLRIGPVIGFVAYSNKKHLSPKRLERMKGRFSTYSEIGGLIFIFAAKEIDTEKKIIHGYYYNSKGEDANTRWLAGTFPYPDVVYKRHPIDTEKYNDLLSQIGDKVINSYYFCKGEINEYSLVDNELAKYFPYTETLSDGEQVIRFLDKYRSIYLKPRDGAGGKGIFHVSKDEQELLIITNRNREKTIINNEDDLQLFLKNLINKKYIIQQSVSISRNDQNVDFRIYAQKNHLKEWVCQGMIGRVSIKNTIITNLKYVEKLLSGEDAIKFLFEGTADEVNGMKQKIYITCINLCKTLDKTIGNYGDVAIDCIIDDQDNIWVLEVNKLYGYDSLIKMKNRQLVKILRTTPFHYAKSLAEF
ncbi:YheC/YheD family protein [Metabacillus litoralis]|uniref:YheC/YheD family endospore coat-associated protein n=1 Tax=Metabacillus litoralis TaxID=152268 RepID=UPI001CFE255A|nr:YheC/YheD family protein [Metabacillus litoralis]